jgi:hypothetical protein
MNSADSHDCVIIGAGKLMPPRTSDIFVLTLYRTIRHRCCQHVLGIAPERHSFGPRVEAMSRGCLVVWHDLYPHMMFVED